MNLKDLCFVLREVERFIYYTFLTVNLHISVFHKAVFS